MARRSKQDIVRWLHHFGYLDTRSPSEEQYRLAVVRMQQIYGLVVDADPGPVTQRAMSLFRCGDSDKNLARHIKVDAKHCKWQKKELTYVIGGQFVLSGDRARCLEILRQGFKLYEPLTGLKFREINDWHSADIRIGRGSGSKFGMDGPGNILAWAFMPCDVTDSPLQAMFDDSEPWNLSNSGAGILMSAVWHHELGHLLGLDHSDDPLDLMAPFYNPRILLPQTGDVTRLTKLYNVVPPKTPPVDPGNPPVPGMAFGNYPVTGTMVLEDPGTIRLQLQ